MPARGRLTFLAALLAGVGLVACGGDDEPTATPADPTTSETTAAPGTTGDGATTTAPTSATAATEPADVPEFLDFVAPDVRGGQVTGAELAGQDLVIWFWAPW